MITLQNVHYEIHDKVRKNDKVQKSLIKYINNNNKHNNDKQFHFD